MIRFIFVVTFYLLCIISEGESQSSAIPSDMPSMEPSATPTIEVSDAPSTEPSTTPVTSSEMPSMEPSDTMSIEVSDAPSTEPSTTMSIEVSDAPSTEPSATPVTSSDMPSMEPSATPSYIESNLPSNMPSNTPSNIQTNTPSNIPSNMPSNTPSLTPTAVDAVILSTQTCLPGFTPDADDRSLGDGMAEKMEDSLRSDVFDETHDINVEFVEYVFDSSCADETNITRNLKQEGAWTTVHNVKIAKQGITQDAVVQTTSHLNENEDACVDITVDIVGFECPWPPVTVTQDLVATLSPTTLIRPSAAPSVTASHIPSIQPTNTIDNLILNPFVVIPTAILGVLTTFLFIPLSPFYFILLQVLSWFF